MHEIVKPLWVLSSLKSNLPWIPRVSSDTYTIRPIIMKNAANTNMNEIINLAGHALQVWQMSKLDQTVSFTQTKVHCALTSSGIRIQLWSKIQHDISVQLVNCDDQTRTANINSFWSKCVPIDGIPMLKHHSNTCLRPNQIQLNVSFWFVFYHSPVVMHEPRMSAWLRRWRRWGPKTWIRDNTTAVSSATRPSVIITRLTNQYQRFDHV